MGRDRGGGTAVDSQDCYSRGLVAAGGVRDGDSAASAARDVWDRESGDLCGGSVCDRGGKELRLEWPPELKPAILRCDLRGPEGPLFHGGSPAAYAGPLSHAGNNAPARP